MISGEQVNRSKELKWLDNKCYEIMQYAHRPNTRRNRRSQAAIYQRFCDTYNLVELPADKWQLCRYAIYTADRVTAHATVSNYVGGVRSLQQAAGYVSPITTVSQL